MAERKTIEKELSGIMCDFIYLCHQGQNTTETVVEHLVKKYSLTKKQGCAVKEVLQNLCMGLSSFAPLPTKSVETALIHVADIIAFTESGSS